MIRCIPCVLLLSFAPSGCHLIADYSSVAAADARPPHDAAATDGALPADAPAPRDAPSFDGPRLLEASVPDLTTDQLVVDAAADMGPAWQLLFSLRTASVDPHLFDPTSTKGGVALRWDLGYGDIVHGNAIAHVYRQAGEKLVRVFCSDGVAGLTALRSTSNMLVGTIPPELGELSALTQLSLYDNQLEGQIPAALGKLTNLRSLSLSQNQLTGSIPTELADLDLLTWISLYENKLTGSVPPELGQLRGLESLDLSANQLSGAIPPQLGSLVELDALSLSGNQLGGTIPVELNKLSKLRLLFLADNQLTRYAPGALSGLLALESVNVSGNFLDQASVDALIDDLYRDRAHHTTTDSKYLFLVRGNAVPSAEALGKVAELQAWYDWVIYCTGC